MYEHLASTGSVGLVKMDFLATPVGLGPFDLFPAGRRRLEFVSVHIVSFQTRCLHRIVGKRKHNVTTSLFNGWDQPGKRGSESFTTQLRNSFPAIRFSLAIHQNDHQARRRFVEWAQNEIVVVPDFHKRILFSDEAHFWLNGYVNKQNCRIWSEANPQVYVETPLHPEKLTVWCALWAGGILLQKR
ncbi:hypothetical protein TNCV_2943441 [Trichonephila clavipes]|nr:hypothetical protein TNCV_2943441 [Trichonephila clavipes]